MKICHASNLPEKPLCDCTGNSCVLEEFRALKKPGGREAAREAYAEQLRARAAELDRGTGDRDLPHKLQQLGVPYACISALNAPVETRSLAAARRFCTDKFCLLLTLQGAAGVGKSVAAAYVLREFARSYPWNNQPTGTAAPAAFVAAAEFTRVSHFDQADHERLRALAACKLLVLDDMGNEGSAVGRTTLLDLLKTRFDAGRRTVLTTNLTRAALVAAYGPAIASRLDTGISPVLDGEKSLRTRKLA